MFAGIELEQAHMLSRTGNAATALSLKGINIAAAEESKRAEDKIIEPVRRPSLSIEMPKSGFDAEENSAAHEVTEAAAAAEKPIAVRLAAEWLKSARFTALAMNKANAIYRSPRCFSSEKNDERRFDLIV